MISSTVTDLFSYSEFFEATQAQVPKAQSLVIYEETWLHIVHIYSIAAHFFVNTLGPSLQEILHSDLKELSASTNFLPPKKSTKNRFYIHFIHQNGSRLNTIELRVPLKD